MCKDNCDSSMLLRLYFAWQLNFAWGTGIRGVMRGLAIFPQDNRETLMVKDKVGRTPGELGVILFPFSALTLLALGGLRGCKNRPTPFPGRMSYKATKPGLVCLSYLSMLYYCIVVY